MDTSDNLKLKQCPVDVWTTREQLCLTSAVSQSGDQNWAAVSRIIRQLTTETDRPPDWYSTKNCASQYAKLLEQVNTPKRKREKGEDGANDTPGEIVNKMLSKKRVEELKDVLEEEKVAYQQLRKEIIHLESNSGQLDNRLHQVWDEIIKKQEKEEKEATKRREFYKEREEKIKGFQGASKVYPNKASACCPPKKGLSPAKTQSLKKPSATDDDGFVKTEDCETEEPEVLVGDEAAPSPTPLSTASKTGFMSQINENDDKGVEDLRLEKDFAPVVKEEVEIKSPEDGLEDVHRDTSFESNMPLDYTSNLNAEMKDLDPHDIIVEDPKKIIEDTELVEDKAEDEEPKTDAGSDRKQPEIQVKEEEKEVEDANGEEQAKEREEEEEEDREEKEVKEEEEEEEGEEGSLLKLESRDQDSNDVEEKEETKEIKGEEEEKKPELKKRGRKRKHPITSLMKEETKACDMVEVKRELDSEYLSESELKHGPGSSCGGAETPSFCEREEDRRVKKEARDEYEFDDDASRESTDVKDYMSRSDRRKFSLGESVSSPVVSESTPSSPASTNYGDDPEAEKLHRSWKRSIMLIWNDIAAHKNASIFLKPISEEKVPGYHSIVYRPIDLMTIKRSIENGSIRTTPDFQRDIMLMFMNAKMYNTREHNVYRMAEHMMNDAVENIEEFISAQMLAKVVETPQKTLRRETRESSAKRVGEDMKRKRDEREEKTMKRRKI